MECLYKRTSSDFQSNSILFKKMIFDFSPQKFMSLSNSIVLLDVRSSIKLIKLFAMSRRFIDLVDGTTLEGILRYVKFMNLAS